MTRGGERVVYWNHLADDWVNLNVKGNFTLGQARKGQRGSKGIDLLFL
jgi:hypothetical protein